MARRGKKRTGAHLWEALGLLGLLTAGACFDSKPPASGNSNWLSPCDTSDDCADGTSCECGVCAITCDATSDCGEAGEGAVCGVAAAWGSQCESQSAADARVCTVVCDSDNVCEGAMGSGFICVGTACLSSDGFMSRPGTGGDAGPTGGMTGGSMEPTGGMTGGTVNPETGGATTGGIAHPETGGALPDTGGVVDPNPGPVDGDGECESGETPETAPRDCAVAGDGLCTGDENPATDPVECPFALVSVDTDGNWTNSDGASISKDGSRLAYRSVRGAFVRDLITGTVTEIFPQGPFGAPGVDNVVLSDDGRLVLATLRGPIEANDSNIASDGYLLDLETHEFLRVTLDLDGQPFADDGVVIGFNADNTRVYYQVLGADETAGDYEYVIATGERNRVDEPRLRPVVSGDDRVKVWPTKQSRLPGDINGASDVYAAERNGTGQDVTLISLSEEGYGGNGGSTSPSVSLDGRLVAFQSDATNLTSEVSFGTDILVKDRVSGRVLLVSTDEVFSVAPTGATENGRYFDHVTIAGDGRYVVYRYRWTGAATRDFAMVLHYIGDWVDSLPDP